MSDDILIPLFFKPITMENAKTFTRLLYLVSILFFTPFILQAQQDCEIFCSVTNTFINVCSECDNVIAADNCADAATPSICELDGFQTTTCAFTPDGPGGLPLFCGPNTIVHNNIWIGFEPAFNGRLHLNIEIIECLSPNTQCNGVQAAVSRALCANPGNVFFGYEYLTLDCVNCVDQTFDLITVDAQAGVPHYIMIDGCCGDACEIVVHVIDGLPDPGWTLEPVVGTLCPDVLNPECLSPNSSAQVYANPNADADPNSNLEFTWYDPNGVIMWQGPGIPLGGQQFSSLNGINPMTGDPYFCIEGDYTVTVRDLSTCCFDESETTLPIGDPLAAAVAYLNPDEDQFDCEIETIRLIGEPEDPNVNILFQNWWKVDWTSYPPERDFLPSAIGSQGPELTITLEDRPTGAGTYLYTFIDDASFCVSETFICVPADTIKPMIDIEEPSVLDCGTNPTVTIDASDSEINRVIIDCSVGDILAGEYPKEEIVPTDNYIVQWTSDDGYSIVDENTLTPTVTNNGWYTCMITNLDNKCVSEARVFVDGNVDPPVVDLPSTGILDCNNSFGIEITGSHTNAANASYSWTDENGNQVGTDPTLDIDQEGVYILTVTNNDNQCLAQASVSVTENNPDMSLEAIPTGTLTCLINSTDFNPILNGGGAEILYEWTDEDGNVVSNMLDYTATGAGSYTLTVTDVSSGCTTETTVAAIVDGDLPEITMIPDVTLNCINEFSTDLDASASGGSNLTYEWFNDANDLLNSGTDLTVTAAGTYSVVVLNTDNGCSSTESVNVIIDDTPPTVEAGEPVLLNCANDLEVSVTGSGDPSANITYEWIDPSGNVVSSTADLDASVTGTYTLIITDLDNGCTASDELIVDVNDSPPDPDAGLPQILNCTNEMLVTLDGSASSGQSTLTYEWTDPAGNLVGTTSDLEATVIGTYTLVVTDAENGCTAETTVDVTEDLSPPDGLTATDGLLSCSAESVNLSGGSSTSNVSYNWVSPGGVNYDGQSVDVNEPGIYTMVVTNLDNGCTAEITTEILNDDSVPPVDFSFLTGVTVLDCNVSVTDIEGITDDGINLEWFDADGNALVGNPISVTEAGSYTVVVTNPVNDCDNTTTVSVTSDYTEPEIETVPATILCAPQDEVEISASSAQGISFDWTGPSGFNSTGNNPMVTEAGDYTVIVTGQNGCTSETIVRVDLDQDPPDLSAAPDFTLTCLEPSYSLNATADVMANFAWTGPAGFSSTAADPTINEAGTYTLTATNAANNCEASIEVVIDIDQEEPDVSAIGGTLTCSENSLNIQGTSDESSATYSWTGPAGFSSTEQNPEINADGTYTLLVTAANGCTAETTAQVDLDDEAPNVEAGNADPLTCANLEMIDLAGSATISNGNLTYNWLDPSNNSIAQTENTTVTAAGTYTLVVTNDSNGCTATDEVIVDSNVNPPIADPGDPSELNCLNELETTIDGSGSSGEGNLIYEWLDPSGNVLSGNSSSTVNSPGTYTLIITDESNGCTEEATVNITENTDPPEGLIAQGGMLSCTVEDITLTGSSSSSNVSYEWLSPGSVSITGQDVSVVEPGIYTMIVTNLDNGCTAETTAEVTNDDSVPSVDFAYLNGSSNVINCNNSVAEVEGITEPGVELQWFAPDGAELAGNPITITESGTYTLTVLNPVNECDNMTSVNIVADFEEPIMTTTTGTIFCAPDDNVEITVDGNGDSYSWSGPAGFNSTSTSSMVSEAGIYEVIATGTNGCTSMTSLEVDIDQEAPSATAAEDFLLTCIETEYGLDAQTDISTAIYLWNADNGFTSSEANPIIDEAGIYTLLVTNMENNCTASYEVEITASQDFPTAEASGGVISCNQQSLILSGATDVAGATYEWTGPSGFSSEEQNPEIDLEGTYTLIVTAPNGCSREAEAIVEPDFDEPNVFASGGIITCTESNITINGGSNTNDVTFLWQGPSNYSSTEENPTVTDAGTYTLIATSANGCTASTSVEVETDENLPDASTEVSDDLDCNVSMVEITGTSTVAGASFSWALPDGNVSTSQIIQAEMPGQYILTVTAPNGCPNQTTATVILNDAAPQINTSDGLIDCVQTSTNLNGTSTTENVSYLWSGPAGFSSTEQNPEVDEGGLYTLILTDPSNGCTAEMDLTIDVEQDNPDITVDFENVSRLDCNNPELTILGSTSTADAILNWSGPDGFSSLEESELISTAGTYTLIVEAANGCTSTADLIVTEDFAIPAIATTGNLITCEITTVDIQAVSNDNVSYAWTGPGGFISSEAMPLVSEGGTYTVIVTSEDNGCTNTATADVEIDQGIPTATADGDIITCSNPSIEITGEGSTSGSTITYEWLFNGVVVSSDISTMASETGTYTLIVTDASNNCTAQSSFLVLDNIEEPIAEAGADQLLRCIDEFVTLDGSASIGQGDISYEWVNENGSTVGTEASLQTDQTGIFTLTIFDAANGCSSSSTVEVTPDENAPEVTLAEVQILTCETLTTNLDATATTGQGTLTYTWTDGAGNIIGSGPLLPTDVAGDFTVTVIDESNGCVTSSSIEVIANQDIPVINIAEPNVIDCNNETIALDLTTSISQAEYSWTGPNGFNYSDQNPSELNLSGVYSVTVTDPTNGCTQTEEVIVQENLVFPLAAANVDDILDCVTSEVTIDGAGTSAGLSYQWSGPQIISGENTLNPVVAAAGIYTLTVYDDSNGCETETLVEVEINDTVIEGMEYLVKPATCFGPNTGTFNITNIVEGNEPFMFSLDGGASFTSQIDYNTLSAGDYDVIIEDALGCTWEEAITVGPALTLELDLMSTAEDNKIRYGDSLDLLPQTNFNVDNFVWGDSSLSNLEPTVAPLSTTTYSIITYDENGCPIEDFITIFVEVVRPVYIPSAFSPNGDGTNDVFMIFSDDNIIAEVQSFQVYDRWGEKVFEDFSFKPNDPTHSWDGNHRNEEMQPGVYVYYALIEFIDGEVVLFEGDVSIIK